MHDFGLGGPVDVGMYDGPVLDGKPLHNGNCEDGVYGCRMCNAAIKKLTPEQMRAIGGDPDATRRCDWCKKEVNFKDIRTARPSEEGGAVMYEVCSACKKKHDDAESEELERMREEDGYYDHLYDD